jgi:hypothetical protein
LRCSTRLSCSCVTFDISILLFSDVPLLLLTNFEENMRIDQLFFFSSKQTRVTYASLDTLIPTLT